tara:strand:- start:195 stop:371 length:177 start_codon:yes stop_codon:yes gene_type:complete
MEAIIEKIKVLDSIVTTPKRVLQPADSKKFSFSKKTVPPPSISQCPIIVSGYKKSSEG